MLAIEELNQELSTCLKQAGPLHSRLSTETDLGEAEIQVIFDHPVLAPCYILLAVACELGVTRQIHEILHSYSIQLNQD